MRSCRWISISSVVLCVALTARVTHAQSYGVELHNTLMPASGGMAGTSLARPQDVQSAINANPATLTQFRGTQFSFSGAWAESTYNLAYDGSVPVLNALGLSPFDAKSGAPGSALGNIGVTQDVSALGLPATLGIGLNAASGASAQWRAEPGSNGTTVSFMVLVLCPFLFLGLANSKLAATTRVGQRPTPMFKVVKALDMIAGAGVKLTDRLSLGASLSLGTGFLDGPWVGATGNAAAFGLRGRLGADYDLTDCTSLGLYYQTKQHFTFDENIRFPIPGPAGDVYLDTNLELPQNLGIGIANRRLLDGRLLLAVDVLYKQWSDADLFGALYDDQWVVQLGSQYTAGRVRLRLGYAWADNPLLARAGESGGGISPPGGRPVMEYVQSTLAVANEHRITGGIGVCDILPGIDFDLFAGGMFGTSQEFANGAISTSLESYWIGTGITWHFGRGACERGDWSSDSLR